MEFVVCLYFYVKYRRWLLKVKYRQGKERRRKILTLPHNFLSFFIPSVRKTFIAPEILILIIRKNFAKDRYIWKKIILLWKNLGQLPFDYWEFTLKRYSRNRKVPGSSATRQSAWLKDRNLSQGSHWPSRRNLTKAMIDNSLTKLSPDNSSSRGTAKKTDEKKISCPFP